MATFLQFMTFVVLASLFVQTTAFFAFSPGLDHFPYNFRARVRSAASANRAGPHVVGTLSDGELVDALFLTGDPLGDCASYAACQRRLDYHVRKLRKLMNSAAMKARINDMKATRNQAHTTSTPSTQNNNAS